MPRVAPLTHPPPPLTRRRPIEVPTCTARDRASSSIGGRRASGFLQVSLSKVPRVRIGYLPRPAFAEALPINASDFSDQR
jgi:hypothetical protein